MSSISNETRNFLQDDQNVDNFEILTTDGFISISDSKQALDLEEFLQYVCLDFEIVRTGNSTTVKFTTSV